MTLAAVLTVLLLVTAIKDDPENPGLDKRTGIYLLMALVAVGLGYSGGELMFG
jgi:hypothetical protein